MLINVLPPLIQRFRLGFMLSPLYWLSFLILNLTARRYDFIKACFTMRDVKSSNFHYGVSDIDLCFIIDEEKILKNVDAFTRFWKKISLIQKIFPFISSGKSAIPFIPESLFKSSEIIYSINYSDLPYLNAKWTVFFQREQCVKKFQKLISEHFSSFRLDSSFYHFTKKYLVMRWSSPNLQRDYHHKKLKAFYKLTKVIKDYGDEAGADEIVKTLESHLPHRIKSERLFYQIQKSQEVISGELNYPISLEEFAFPFLKVEFGILGIKHEHDYQTFYFAEKEDGRLDSIISSIDPSTLSRSTIITRALFNKMCISASHHEPFLFYFANRSGYPLTFMPSVKDLEISIKMNALRYLTKKCFSNTQELLKGRKKYYILSELNKVLMSIHFLKTNKIIDDHRFLFNEYHQEKFLEMDPADSITKKDWYDFVEAFRRLIKEHFLI